MTVLATIAYEPRAVSVSDERGTVEGYFVTIEYSDGRATRSGEIIDVEGPDPSAWLGDLHTLEEEVIEALATGAGDAEIWID